MAICKTTALVLKRRDYRDTSYLLTFYSRDFGLLRCIAKGAKRRDGRFTSPLEPLMINAIVFYESRRTDLHTLTSADLEREFPRLRKDPIRFAYGCYFAELVEAAWQPGDVNPKILALLAGALEKLEACEVPGPVARSYEVALLAEAGLLPKFDACTGCGGVIAGEAHFSLGAGGLVCARCVSREPSAFAISQETAAALQAMRKGLQPEPMGELSARELEKCLALFIEFHFDRRLKSPGFIRQVERSLRVLSNPRVSEVY